jgi:acetyl esterase/lipase
MLRFRSALLIGMVFFCAIFTNLLISLSTCVFAEEPTRIRDVVYGRKFGMALVMDVLKPAKPNGIGAIFMMSGGFGSDIAMIEGLLINKDLLRPYTDRGDTVFLVCHGSQPKYTVAEIVPDIHRAVRFIRYHSSEYGVDPNRLGISGASSGGFLALSIGTKGEPGNPAAPDPVDRVSSQVQAVGCFFPPTDLADYGKVGRTFLEYEPVKFVWHTVPVSDKPKEEQLKILRELSPYYSISKNTPPTLIFHGDNDELVPLEQSERFMIKLEENNVPHQLILRKGAGHGWIGMEKDNEMIADWFDKQLAKH